MKLPGDKIKINCKTDKCPIYAVALALNNLSGPEYTFSCPEQFCLYMREYPIVKCAVCEQDKNILICSIENDKFVCAYCKEDVINKRTKIKKETQPTQEEAAANTAVNTTINKDIKIIESINEKSNVTYKVLKSLTSGYLNRDNFVFEQSDNFTFCNPIAEDPAKGLLNISKKELSQLSEKGLQDILSKFYGEVLMKYEKKDCVGCVNAEHYPNHIECIECSRNDQSASLQRKDKYVKASS